MNIPKKTYQHLQRKRDSENVDSMWVGGMMYVFALHLTPHFVQSQFAYILLLAIKYRNLCHCIRARFHRFVIGMKASQVHIKQCLLSCNLN